MMTMEQSTVLLTGATGGIGRELALQLSAKGARLILVGRDSQKLTQMMAELSGSGHRAVEADLTVDEDRQRVVQSATEGGIDVLINNAGLSAFQLLEQQNRIRELVTVNLISPMELCRDCLPILRQQGKGLIVNIGSTFGSIGYPGFSVYCGSKFGLRGFTQALRRELAGSGIDVLYVAPRACRTDINDERVNGLNEALGNAVDAPESVARDIIDAMAAGQKNELYLGWPEKLFVKINAIAPALVDGSLLKQLPVVRRFCK